MKNFIYLFCLITLIGCDDTKQKLPGTRESFVTIGDYLKNDSSLKSIEVVMPAAINNESWPTVGGNTQHNMPPLKTKNKLNKQWSVIIGEGAGTYHRLTVHPVIANNIIFTMDVNSILQARNTKDGSLLWEQNLNHNESDSTANGGGFAIEASKLYVTTGFGDVWCFEAKSGKKLWMKNLPNPIKAAPTIKNEKIYILTINNEIICLSAKNGEEIWDYAGIIEPNSLLGGAAPALTDDIAIAALTSGEVYAFGAKVGNLLWSDTITSALRIDTFSSISHIRARPIIDNYNVYIASHGGKIVCYSLNNGERLWNQSVGALRTPAIGGDFLFVVTTNDELACLQKTTGKIKWSVQLPRKREAEDVVTWAGPIIVNDQLLIVSSGGQMITASTKNGTITNTYEIASPCQVSPIVANGTVYILLDSGELQAWQ